MSALATYNLEYRTFFLDVICISDVDDVDVDVVLMSMMDLFYIACFFVPLKIVPRLI